MPKKSSIIIGKLVRSVARLKGGGSALPGLIIEKIDKNFLADTLGRLPKGVVVISGTNGKTTTTKTVVELLESQSLKVFTNRTGSNFVRGVIAAALENINLKGRLDADIAVLELDEAYAVKFAEVVPPTYFLALNVMRDQLDRFGEIDHTADLLKKVAEKTTDSVVINRDDPRLQYGETKAKNLGTFGVSPELLAAFPTDDNLLNNSLERLDHTSHALNNDTNLKSVNGSTAVIAFDGKDYQVNLKLNGIYNVLNAVAAIAIVRFVMKENLQTKKMLERLALVEPAFGRGETFSMNGMDLQIILVKNPSGFQLALDSFDSKKHDVMIAINDNYADGRDMSWLWNVQFSSLDQVEVVSGARATDMALRLKYDEVPFKQIEENLEQAVKSFLQYSSQPKRIFCTYTAMLAIRKYLSSLTKVERIL